MDLAAVPPPVEGDHHIVDLARIDFEKLAEKFNTGRKRTEAERLRAALISKLTSMIRANPTRIDYMERFQALIDAYNAGSINVEEFFRQLMEFTKRLNEEDQRTIAEGLTDEELALFDLVTKPDVELTPKERDDVKKVAHELLETFKQEKLVLDWRKKQQTRAGVQLTIEQALDRLPEVFTIDVYRQKVQRVYQHVYDSYFGEGRSVYTMAAA